MANTAILSTSEVSTGVSRGQHPQAITPHQKQLIESTWKLVEGTESGLMDAGIQLFKNIFTMFPPAQQLFKSFRDLPFEQLPENEDFRSHALQVTETISLAVSSLDDIEGLLLVLKDLGGAHSSYGLQDAHFDVVGKALIATLEQGLGDKFTPEVKEAYLCFYQLVTTNMKDGLSEGYSEIEKEE